MKFRHRILLFSILAITLLAVGAGLAVGIIDHGSRRLADVRVEQTATVSAMVEHAFQAGRHAELYAVTGDRAHLADFESVRLEIDALFKRYEASEGYTQDPDETELTMLANATGSWSQLKAAVAALDVQASGISPYAVQSLVRNVDTLQSDMRAIEERHRTLTAEALRATQSAVRQSLVVVVLVGLLGTALIVMAARVASDSVARPILLLRDVAVRISAGDLEEQVVLSGSDEIAELGNAFEAMRLGLRGALASLHDQVEERTSTEEALADANHELMRTVGQLSRTNTDIGVIGEMGQTLQADLREDEAYSVMALYGRRLFEGMRGAIYLYESDGVVRKVTSWGETDEMPDAFATRECWALRTGKPHRVRDDSGPMPRCEHSHDDGSCFECVPLNAHGEVLGTLVIEGCSATADPAFEGEDRMLITYSEHVALALSNLRLRAKLREQSLRDHLTGLYNRRIMQEALIREIARAKRNKSALVVAMVDIDHFKEYNDQYGHDAGDHVLVEVSGYLRSNTRDGDVACRYGGEEFVLVWSGMELDHAYARAEALRKGIEGLTLEHGGHNLGRITTSIGIAVYPEHGLTGEALVAGADEALYEAKAEGRNRVVLANLVACAVERILPEVK